MIKILFAVGNALLTIGSILALGRKVHYFGGKVKHHNKPKYTQPVKSNQKCNYLNTKKKQ